jgi:hypothetical protein
MAACGMAACLSMATLAEAQETGLHSGDGDAVAVGCDFGVARTADDAQPCWEAEEAQNASNANAHRPAVSFLPIHSLLSIQHTPFTHPAHTSHPPYPPLSLAVCAAPTFVSVTYNSRCI